MPARPVQASVTPGRPRHLRRREVSDARSVQWWMWQFRNPPRLAVPNLMKLQLEERRQLRTSTFSQTKSGLSLFRQIASSSESTVQSSMSTFFESMSNPSLLKLARRTP